MCVKAGCKAACCHDIYTVHEAPIKQVLRVFPGATRMKFYDFVRADLPKGVYFRKLLFGGCDVRIVGACPHLNGIGCKIWDQERLADCRDMSIGSDGCADLRRRDQNSSDVQPQLP